MISSVRISPSVFMVSVWRKESLHFFFKGLAPEPNLKVGSHDSGSLAFRPAFQNQVQCLYRASPGQFTVSLWAEKVIHENLTLRKQLGSEFLDYCEKSTVDEGKTIFRVSNWSPAMDEGHIYCNISNPTGFKLSNNIKLKYEGPARALLNSSNDKKSCLFEEVKESSFETFSNSKHECVYIWENAKLRRNYQVIGRNTDHMRMRYRWFYPNNSISGDKVLSLEKVTRALSGTYSFTLETEDSRDEITMELFVIRECCSQQLFLELMPQFPL
ncbi:hypothetical protein Ciccas_005703 [Cichlidogyrus casuarinus]|uniref:Ig-like domain-containing protein n=1 Tax=Cichlidogyrus casuarinus TaxID=1844966 RepID=A0ABD2Q7X3_9PLAT